MTFIDGVLSILSPETLNHFEIVLDEDTDWLHPYICGITAVHFESLLECINDIYGNQVQSLTYCFNKDLPHWFVHYRTKV